MSIKPRLSTALQTFAVSRQPVMRMASQSETSTVIARDA
jgi:hypothetical protein